MTTRIKVAVAGASGALGSSVTHELLANPDKFEVTALARHESARKPEYTELAERGAIVLPIDISEPSDELIQALTGKDVVISCMTLRQLKEEMALIDAASIAGVGRYVPSFFGPCCPPRGVMFLREKKEDMLDHVKRLYLPYTVIDVGWWYQLALPPLPSGKLHAKFEYSATEIVGDGNVPWALVDNRDIGKYVAKIIADPAMLNKSVFVYGEVLTQNDIWETLEKVSGESLVRKYLSKEELLKTISDAQEKLAKGVIDQASPYTMGVAQYKNMLGVRGDNTPEHARYLGYLDAKEIYPDVSSTSLDVFIRDTLEGRAKNVYS